MNQDQLPVVIGKIDLPDAPKPFVQTCEACGKKDTGKFGSDIEETIVYKNEVRTVVNLCMDCASEFLDW